MNIAALASRFDEEGYIVVEDFFDRTSMDRLDGVIRDYYGENPDFWHNDEFLEKSYTEVVPWFPQREGNHDFDSIEQDERLQQLTTAVLGEGWGSQYCMVMFSKQGTAGQAWHQDCPPDNAARHNLIVLCIRATLSTKSVGRRWLSRARTNGVNCRRAIPLASSTTRWYCGREKARS